jgi:hypothetical protein
MDSLPDVEPSLAPDAAPVRDRPATAGSIEESRRRLAQLIGRLVARHWLRERDRRAADRHDAGGPPPDRTP